VIVVVDTSVVVQWFAPERGTPIAELLLGRDDLAAPDILLVETANVLRKKLRDGQIQHEQAVAAIAFLKARMSQLVPFDELLARAFEIAVQVGHPIYDCMFLACAEKLDGVVATRDAPLVSRASAAGFSHIVRLLTAEWAGELQ